MAYCAKAAALIVGVTGVFGLAQAQRVKPSPQERAASPAPTKAVAPAPQPAAPDSRRFVTNENYFRAGAVNRPPAGNAASIPATPTAGTSRMNNVASVSPQLASQPAIAAANTPLSANLAVPQPPASSTPATSDHNVSAAVDYTSGQLTVISDRASLGQVLKLIAGKTGAVIDVASEVQQEPVVAKLGPSPVRDVLTALLDSPRIDYIVFGTGDEPGSLQRIVVRRRQSFGNSGMGVMRAAQPQPGVEPGGNGQIVSPRSIPGQNEMTQEQRMEEWKKERAQMLEAEMKQSALDRENERNQPPEAAAAQEAPQQQDNPPQR
jgi:hypothetical protein